MVFYLLRGLFLILIAAVAALYLIPNQEGADLPFGEFLVVLLAVLAVAAAIIGLDASTPNKKLSAMSGAFLGLIAGLIVAYPLGLVVDFIGLLTVPQLDFDPQAIAAYGGEMTIQQQADLSARNAYLNLLEGVKILIGIIACYVGISLVLQTRNDFRFVIPYVEFAKQIRGNRPTILDTSVIIDGRVLDIIETKLMQGVVMVPKFVLNELQTVADSQDKTRRERGRRGLEILQKLQGSTLVDVTIEEADAEGGNVDQKLISLAQQVQGRVMTNDYNLNKIATLRGVDVINLNDLAKALRPVALPGETMAVRLVKPGEGATQGVGYLDDGTMVVVENGRDHLNRRVELTVTSTLQTSAGRMIFGRFEREAEGEKAPPDDAGRAADDEEKKTDEHALAGQPVPSRHGGRNPRRSH
jgi:uncharacterized protein YacL